MSLYKGIIAFINRLLSLAGQRPGYGRAAFPCSLTPLCSTRPSHLAQGASLPFSSSAIHHKLRGSGTATTWLRTVGSTADSRQMRLCKSWMKAARFPSTECESMKLGGSSHCVCSCYQGNSPALWASQRSVGATTAWSGLEQTAGSQGVHFYSAKLIYCSR